MTATIERDQVAEARAELVEAEAAHAALTRRLATDRQLTPADLRQSLDAVEFAQRRLAQAEADALDGSRAARRQRLRQLAERASKQAEGLGKLERLAQRFAMVRDELDAAICAWNSAAHGLSEEGTALEAEAAAAGDDLPAIAAELGIGYEFFAQRLQGGTRLGGAQIPKYAIPIVSGGFDPTLARSAPPAPPAGPLPPSCVDSDGRPWKSHIVVKLDSTEFDPRRRGGYECARCRRFWTAAEFAQLVPGRGQHAGDGI